MLKSCLFCQIIKGDVNANIIDQTAISLAFIDINPQANTHILIIPKTHIKSTRELSKHNIHYLSDIALLANKIAKKENIDETGYRWVVNTGKNGGQTVDHIHLHLIGGRQMQWPPG